MKRSRVVAAVAAVLLLSLAIIDAGATVRVGESGWFWGNPQPHGSSLTDLELVGSRGYAVGEGGAILRTDDAGATWTGLPSGGPSLRGASLFQVDAISADTFVVPTAEGCTLRRSDDGGRSFRRLRLVPRGTRCPGPIVSFSFPSSSVGYAALASGIVFRTNNGGASWLRRAPIPGTPVAGGGDASGIELRFGSSESGIAVTDAPSAGRILRTLNGGASWTQVHTVSRGLRSLEFADALTAYAGGDEGTLLKTINGGANWSVPPLVGGGTGTAPFTEIACADSQTCIFGRPSAPPLRTTTGGATADTVDSLTLSEAVDFTSGGRAIAVGEDGFTALSDDNGATFRRLDSRLPIGVRRIRATNASLAVAFGGAGQLGLSQDGGRNWRFVGVAGTDEASDASFPTPTVGYVLEDGGSVLRTRNGGDDWQDAATVRASGLVARTTELVIVAGRGGVQRSTDGAATFRRVGARALRGARLGQLDEAGRAVFAFGDRALARSVNNGRTWRRIRRPTRREVVDVDFVSARVGWVIAEAGGAGQRLYKTTNAGRRWRLIRSIATREMYSLGFATSRTGMVDVDDDDGRVLRTSDGGRTWRPQFISPDTLTVGGLAATGPGTALATDIDGNIFATTTGGDALDSSRLTLRSNRRRLQRPARITLTGRLTPRLADEQIVIASLIRGRWRQRTVETSADGSYRLRVRVRRSTRFVAQWGGDGDARGAGTGSLLVRVRRR